MFRTILSACLKRGKGGVHDIQSTYAWFEVKCAKSILNRYNNTSERRRIVRLSNEAVDAWSRRARLPLGQEQRNEHNTIELYFLWLTDYDLTLFCITAQTIFLFHRPLPLLPFSKVMFHVLQPNDILIVKYKGGGQRY